MKILVLGGQLAALANFRGPLIRDLIAAGHEVVAVAPEPAEPWLGQVKALGATYIEAPLQRVSLNPFADLAFMVWLWRIFRKERPDVVFAFQAKPVIYGMLAAALAGVKRRIAMIEGLGQGFANTAGSWRRRLAGAVLPLMYKVALRFAHEVIFLNADDVDDFTRLGIINGQKVRQIPGIGVDLQHFAQQALPEGPVTFIMIARLLIDKGVREYAAAAAAVKQQYPDACFLLLGPYDPSPAGIRSDEVESWSQLEYLGATSDVRPYLAVAHVFVLPTFYREGMPRSALEALAVGRVVITTDSPGARETVVAGSNGYLVKPRSVAELSAAMLAVLQHPHQLAAMAVASRKMAEERFCVQAINRQIIDAIQG